MQIARNGLVRRPRLVWQRILAAVSGPVEITHEELALILEALDDAAFYRDARSRIVESAVRRRSRGEAPLIATGATRESHLRKVQAYNALAVKLRTRMGKD